MEAFWAVVWRVDRAEMPNRQCLVSEHGGAEALLAADNGQVVVLTKDRKWGTLAKFIGWQSCRSRYREEGRSAQFEGSVRVRLLDFEERAGLVWAFCQPAPLVLRPGERPAVTRLRRKIRQFLQYSSPRMEENTRNLLEISEPLTMIYALAEKHARDTTSMLAAQSVETLIGRLIRDLDSTIERNRAYLKATKPRSRQAWKLHSHRLWQTSIAGVRTCHLPGAELTNPVVGGDQLFVTTFSPGIAAAFDRTTGRLLWSRDLGGLGGRSPVLHGGLLYVKTAITLYCLMPSTGVEVWNFTPYSTEGEWLYTTPVLAGDRLILGDRRGMLWALDRRTGISLWKTQLSPAGSDVNATVFVEEGRVFTASNDGDAICCDLESGQVIWRSKLAESCVDRVMLWNGGLLYRSWSKLQLLSREAGELTWECELGDLIRSCCVAGDYLLVVVNGDISAYRQNELIYSRIPAARLAEISYIAETDKVYESSIMGLSILEPSTGERVYAFEPLREIQSCAPPAYSEGVLYVLSDGGKVQAILHPA